MKINIGSGVNHLEGYENWDRNTGQEAYPLKADGVEEIRASHILEHFPHGMVGNVIKDWVRALKPGGVLKIAVPDFEKIANGYIKGQLDPQGYVMGGQVNKDDFHGTIFDYTSLYDLMLESGLIAVGEWKSDARDCASLPVSLNLMGFKPPAVWPKVSAAITVPRVGWNDFWACALEVLTKMQIPLTRQSGAFWDQGITQAMELALKGEPKYVLTLDFDTIFELHDLQTLILTMERHPECDALVAIQSHRHESTPLFTIKGKDGYNVREIETSAFESDVTQVQSAHFGFSLFRAEKLKELKHPWFQGIPNGEGRWEEGRWDADIYFWREWGKAGNSVFLANRIPVGHLQCMIRWPGRDIQAIYQHPTKFFKDGKPNEVWR